ncbi:MAG: DUF1614 domain-containing protein [Desulfobacterales bacterium]
MQSNLPYGCMPVVFIAVLAVFIPIFLADIMLTAMSRLGMSPETSLLAAMGIFMGGLINIPVKQIPRKQPVEFSPHSMFGVRRFFPGQMRERQFTVLAVNFGGCIVPCIIVLYQLGRLAGYGPGALGAVLAAIGINIAVCYKLAQPVANIGIAMPPLVPALAAAACAILFGHELAPSIAFCAGVTGPLIGADLLHLKDIEKINTGVASIGGAGTFDGIVISGILATLLA